MNRILVVGASGFLGQRVTTTLRVKHGCDVLAWSSRGDRGIDPATGRLRPGTQIPSDVDAVVYLAQSPYYRQLPDMADHVFNVNLVTPVHLGELARRAGVRKFIYASTGSVYAPSFESLSEVSPLRRDRWYALTKLQAEEALNLFRNDLDVTVVRPFCIYGPGQRGMLLPRLIDSVIQGNAVSIDRSANGGVDGGLRLSLTFVEDAAQAIARLVPVTGPTVVNLSGPEAWSVSEIALSIGDVLGCEPTVQDSARIRDSDLIADCGLLRRTVTQTWTPFAEGLRQTVASQRESSLCSRH